MPYEDDDTKVGRNGVRDKERTEDGRPGEEGVWGVADEFDGEQKTTDGQRNEKEKDFKGGDIDEVWQLSVSVEHFVVLVVFVA